MNILLPWLGNLPLQQQIAVVFCLRGADGVRRDHPSKRIVAALRACTMNSARSGRPLTPDEGDLFIDLRHLQHKDAWTQVLDPFFNSIDELPVHFVQHLMQASNVVRLQHPNEMYRARWTKLYYRLCTYFNAVMEPDSAFHLRLNDWDRKHWSDRITLADTAVDDVPWPGYPFGRTCVRLEFKLSETRRLNSTIWRLAGLNGYPEGADHNGLPGGTYYFDQSADAYTAIDRIIKATDWIKSGTALHTYLTTGVDPTVPEQ